jgi:hypothetical protein
MFKNKIWLPKIFILLVMTALISTVALVTSGDTAQSSSKLSSKSIVGSWELVDDNSGDTFLLTYNGGPLRGTVNATSPDNSVGLTHGAWKRTGPRTFADTDIGFIYDENGIAILKIKFRAESEVDESGDTAQFNFEFEISDFDGNVVDSGASSGIGTRIKVEPLGP